MSVQVICVVARTEAGSSQTIDPSKLIQENAHVRQAYADGVVRQIWSRADAGGAVVLLEVADLAEAKAFVASLPMAAAGLIELDRVFPLQPYRGFGPTA